MPESPNIPPNSDLPDNSASGAFQRKRGGRVTDRIMPSAEQYVKPSFLHRVVMPYLDKLVAPGGALARNVDQDELRVRLLRAGFPMGLRAQSFLLVKLAGIFVGALLFLAATPIFILVAGALGLNLAWWTGIFFCILGALYGFALPDTWLGIKIRARQKEIQLALPDMIDLISISVEAGLGLMMAIQRISDRFNNPLSEEFLRTLQEVRLGRPQQDALRDMARRVDVTDLTTLLTAIIQAEALGLAVANVLRIQSERLRERRAQRAREAAQKAPIKMTFPLVLFIFPALFIVILGPAIIKIFLEGGGI